MPSIRKTGAKVKPLFLSDDDRQMLHESSLTDETIAANGIHTETNMDVVGELLNWDPPYRGERNIHPVLVFPYANLKGEYNGYTRLRPANPRRDRSKKKLVKYESPRKLKDAKGKEITVRRAYFPAASREALKDKYCPLILTEGEKKSLALSQLNLGAGWTARHLDGGRGSQRGVPAHIGFDWAVQNREVLIVFDYDPLPAPQRDSHDAQLRTVGALNKDGAKQVLIVQLPPGPNNTKMGVDDYIFMHGAAAFRKLMDEAKPINPEPLSTDWKLDGKAGRSDIANARRLVERFGDVIRRVGPWGKWLTWDGKRWAVEECEEVQEYTKQIASGLYTELGEVSTRGNANKDLLAAMAGFIKHTSSATGLVNMARVARRDRRIQVSPDDLNKQPWLLNTLSGTIDLRTGKLRPHDQSDRLTQLVPLYYDPAAKCPIWERFLETVQRKNQRIIKYLQRLVGYSLTGDVSEQLLVFLYGQGNNGKSTFIEVLKNVLGKDYAMKASPELLLSREYETHPTERMDLYEKRFVGCVETENGKCLNETFVKEATGGDTMRGHKMHRDGWEFETTHKIWMAGNYKPIIKGRDKGIWRRVKLINFSVDIPDADVDKHLKEKLVAEWPGILAWAVRGCLDWQTNGMQEPVSVREDTAGYRREMDLVGQFIEARCDLGPAYWTRTKDLFAAFKEDYPGPEYTPTKFGLDMRYREGLRAERGNGSQPGWRGLMLRPTMSSEVAARAVAKLKRGGK